MRACGKKEVEARPKCVQSEEVGKPAVGRLSSLLAAGKQGEKPKAREEGERIWIAPIKGNSPALRNLNPSS